MKALFRYLMIGAFALIYANGLLAQGSTCATAVSVAAGSHAGDGPSAGAGFVSSSCWATSSNGNHADWYTYTATGTGTVTISSDFSPFTDTRLSVFTGSCGTLTCIASDDDSGTGGSSLGSVASFSVTMGTTYYIQWDSRWSTAAYNWSLTFTPPAPECAAGTLITCGQSTTVTLSGSGIGWSVSACGFSTPGQEAFYRIMAPSAGSYNLQVSGGTPGGYVDYFWRAAGGCGTGGWTCIDDISGSGNVNFTLPAAGEYYILLDGEGTSSRTQTFQINCPAPPPTNDECLNAIPLTVGTSCSFAQYTNASATGSVGPPAPGCASYSGGDVWFSVVVPAGGRIIIDTDDAVVTDGGMAIYSGNCGALTLIECNDDGSDNGLMPLIDKISLTPGSTIYIRFWEFGNNNNGTFSICAWAPAPPCNAPGAPSASSITTNSATLSWAAAMGATSYRYSFGTAGHVCGTGSLTTASTSVNLSGLVPNTTYRFCVSTDNCGGGSSSSYLNTTFATAPLPNDACAGAQTVTCGSTINGSTVGAASDATIGSCGIGTGGTPGNGVWYKLVGNGAQVTASLCGSAYDTKIHVYTGTCAGLTCLVSNNDNNACGSGSTRSQVIFNANVGTDYYILVSGFATTTGAFSLNLTCLCGPPLGAPWTVTNIGNSNGGAIENVCDGTIDVKATGFSTTTSDVQTYAWQELCGNGFIKAKVENVLNGGWGGIMFRENNAAGSKKVALRTQLTNMVIRELRATTNGANQQQQILRPTAMWLRIARTGNVFLGETSSNGVNWQFAFSITLVLPNCVEVGLFAQSINVNTTTTAAFSNVMGVPTSPPVIPLVDADHGGVTATQEVLSLFPNPASDEINVKMEAFYGKNVTISVQNQLGQVMLLREIDEVQDATERIELTNLPSGIYTLTLRTAGQAPLSKQFMVGSARP